MTSFSERLAVSKAAPKSFRDVLVLLDAGLSDRRASLVEDLKRVQLHAADNQRLAAPNDALIEAQEALDALAVETAEALVTLRFTRLPGDQWIEIRSRCPMRLDAVIDRQYGFNMDAVCKIAAPLSGGRVEGDIVVPLIVSHATAEASAVDEWADLFVTISGQEMDLIVDAIYDINVYEPTKRVHDLKKDLATRTA